MFTNLYITITLKKLYPRSTRTILHSNKLVLTLELPGYENNYNHRMTLQFFLQLFIKNTCISFHNNFLTSHYLFHLQGF